DLVEDVMPSQELILPLTVTAPDEPGEYILELDMVQEHVAWFKDKGSSTCRLPVVVTASMKSASVGTPVPHVTQPSSVPAQMRDMAIDCIRNEAVADLVTGDGARVLHVEAFGSAGSVFVSYRYYITK